MAIGSALVNSQTRAGVQMRTPTLLTRGFAQILSPDSTISAPSQTPPGPTLSWGQTLIVVGIVAVSVLLAGAIVVWARSSASQPSGGSVVRSWIAISLVVALVLFSAASFALADSNLRSTLIGAVVASVGSAIAYYFSSKSADQARQDLLTAKAETDVIPTLVGMDEQAASGALGRTSFKLEVDPASPRGATEVATQTPVAGSVMPKGSVVTVTLQLPTHSPARSSDGP